MYCRELVKALSSGEFPLELTVLASRFHAEGGLDELAHRPNVLVRWEYQLPKPQRLTWVWDMFTHLGARLGNLDIYHATDPAMIPSLTRRGRIRSVATFYDAIPYLFWNEMKTSTPRDHLWALARARRIAPSLAGIITISDAARSDLIRLLDVDPNRIWTVPLGVHCPTHETDSREAARRVQQRWAVDAPYILYVGAADYRKNLSALVDALRLVRNGGLNVRLVLVGRDMALRGVLEVDQVRNHVDRLGLAEHVKILGYVSGDELADLYAAAGVFCLPSLYEGFGLPALEAMAHGAPVVSGAGGALAEVVAEAGMIVETPTGENLSAALGSVLSDDGLAGRLRQLGRRRAAQFTWARTAAETMRVYQRVA
jgi:glycosyltransferase involved in cell wall biosynthesis